MILITNNRCLFHYSMKITKATTLREYTSSISIGMDGWNDGFTITTTQHIVYRNAFIYILGRKNTWNEK